MKKIKKTYDWENNEVILESTVKVKRLNKVRLLKLVTFMVIALLVMVLLFLFILSKTTWWLL